MENLFRAVFAILRIGLGSNSLSKTNFPSAREN
jgi:hypothetical protein